MFLLFLSALFAPQEDVELIRRLKRRDAQAMGDLYDRFGNLTYAVIRSRKLSCRRRFSKFGIALSDSTKNVEHSFPG